MSKSGVFKIICLTTLFILFAFKNNTFTWKSDLIKIPKGFPKIEFPAGNEYTRERWEFGKKLFYDTSLSKSGKINCASCHIPQLAFSDSIAFSLGDNNAIGKSNAPSLTNIAYHPYFTRAGGVPTLEMQILVPIQEHLEFNTNILDIAERLKQNKEYIKFAQKCYGRELDPYVITRAIANFERSFISGNSPFDKYNYQNNKNALSKIEKEGMNLFNSSKTDCFRCHEGFNFTSYSFENNGLYETYKDVGRMLITQENKDSGKFKVASLRNIELTAPYMHDGSLKSLEDVINHYDSGGKNHPNKSSYIRPLHLSKEEKYSLIMFLKSLTDKKFITDKKFRN